MIIVGSVNVDLVITVPSLPAPGETVLGGALATGLGGKGANQAVAAARLGVRPTLLASVSLDSHGQFAAEQLEREGVQLALRRSAVPSGLALIGVSSSGENSIMVYPGANAALHSEHLDPALFQGAGVAVVQFEVPKDTWQRALHLAKSAGVQTVANASPIAGITLADLKDVDVLVVNEHEAATLLGVSSPLGSGAVSAASALSHFFMAVVITLGARGAVWASRTEKGHASPHSVSVVDTTGAGDAFCGAFCAALEEGVPFPEAVAWGNAAGALTATRPGTVNALPTRREIMAVLANVGAY